MWVLYLNDMRSPKIQMLTPVARAETKEQLQAFVKRETVELYREDQGPAWPEGAFWGKTFRKGGLLEWCNQPSEHDESYHYRDMDVIVREFLAEQCRIPEVG